MNTTLQAITTVYKLINTSALKSMINGSVYKGVRPYTGKEDIVIGSLPMSGQGIQKCTINVNIHLPAIAVTVGGKTIDAPNYSRFSELLTVAVPLLEAFNGTDYNAWLALQSDPIKEEEVSEFYVNLRIEFRYFTFK